MIAPRESSAMIVVSSPSVGIFLFFWDSAHVVANPIQPVHSVGMSLFSSSLNIFLKSPTSLKSFFSLVPRTAVLGGTTIIYNI